MLSLRSAPRSAISRRFRVLITSIMMVAILGVVVVYLRLAGTGAFMGEEDEAR